MKDVANFLLGSDCSKMVVLRFVQCQPRAQRLLVRGTGLSRANLSFEHVLLEQVHVANPRTVAALCEVDFNGTLYKLASLSTKT